MVRASVVTPATPAPTTRLLVTSVADEVRITRAGLRCDFSSESPYQRSLHLAEGDRFSVWIIYRAAR